jgi:hypothetical protein
MLVKDKLADSEYKRRPTVAVSLDCPCRPCYNAHDCGHRNTIGKWVERMCCITNFNNGCPNDKPKPVHTFKGKGKVCKRCGERIC